MTSGTDFSATVRRGRRTVRPRVVLHSRLVPADRTDAVVGFVVSKAVGQAVVRNRVKRRLRHRVASRLADSPAGLQVVVRALPGAAREPDRLLADLDEAWSSAARAGWIR